MFTLSSYMMTSLWCRKKLFRTKFIKIYLDKKIILKASKVETIDWTVKLQLWLEKVHHHQFIVEAFGAFEIGIGNSLPCELVWWQKFDVSICIHILICLVILLATSLLFKDHILWCCTPYDFFCYSWTHDKSLHFSIATLFNS